MKINDEMTERERLDYRFIEEPMQAFYDCM